MARLQKQFFAEDVELLEREAVYQGFFKMEKLKLRHRLFQGGWSKPMTRELFVRNEAVGILPYDPVNKLVGLIEQFRVGGLEDKDGPWLFELIAGVCDEGEKPEQTARREMVEEAGLNNVSLHPLYEYWVSPGGTNEKLHLFCGITDLSNAGGTFGVVDEQEDIRLHVVPEASAFQAMEQGLCNNSATIMALLWLQLYRHKLTK